LIECRNTISAGRKVKTMKDAVRRLNVEYGFNLSEQEIDIVAKQAEEAALLFQPLFEVDLTDIPPLTEIDKRVKKTAATKKGKK
jgi:Asp-tRNA(Asn)/Glu-tRNA(Gln) amidotransferase C subunit